MIGLGMSPALYAILSVEREKMAGSHEWSGASCLVAHYSNKVGSPLLPQCQRCRYCHAWIRPENMSQPCPGRMGAAVIEQKTRFPEGAEL